MSVGERNLWLLSEGSNRREQRPAAPQMLSGACASEREPARHEGRTAGRQAPFRCGGCRWESRKPGNYGLVPVGSGET
jgi:hypothetical protein